MTEENYQYRTSQTMLRNQFEGEGIFKTPIIPKADFTDKDFENLLLIGFDRARADDEKNRNRMVHFFLCSYIIPFGTAGAGHTGLTKACA